MQYEVEVNGRVRQVHVHRHGGLFAISVEGREWTVDVARLDHHLVSMLMRTGDALVAQSHEMSIARVPASGEFTVVERGLPIVVGLDARRRWGRSNESGAAGTGPQRVAAPMPGKVTRILVRAGDRVQAKQAVVVVEAMKMENELRAAFDGIVTEILVKEGQSVDASAPLLVVKPA